MAARKKTTEVAEEVKNVVDETEEVKNVVEEAEEVKDIPTEETTEETKEETPGETLSNSLDKLVNAVTDKINKDMNTPKPAAPEKKKPWKLGFWGYLGLIVVTKATVEIVKAVADSKRPRK